MKKLEKPNLSLKKLHVSKVKTNISYNIHGPFRPCQGKARGRESMEEFHLGFLLRNLLALEPGKQKSEVKSILWRGGSSSHDPRDC